MTSRIEAEIQLPQKDFPYPETQQRVHIENWHGTEIVDNYHWLQDETDEVKNWDETQNKFARSYLDSLPQRNAIKERIKKWLDLPEIDCPNPCGDKIFQWKRKAGENQDVLYMGPDLAHLEVLIDPNKFSEDGTTSVGGSCTTQDGKFVAYNVYEGGSDYGIIKIKDTDTKEDLSDIIPYISDAHVAWLPDNSGFYYERYAEPGSVPKGEEHYERKLYFHRLGTDWKNDPIIFTPKDMYDDDAIIDTSYDGKWAILLVSHGWNSDEVYAAKIGKDPSLLDFKPLTVGGDNHYAVLEFNNFFYFKTDYGAPKYRIMKVSCDAVDFSDKSEWEEFVPEGEGVIDDFVIIGGKIILEYLVNAVSRLKVFDLESEKGNEVLLPSLGVIDNIIGEENKPDLYYEFEAYAVPNRIYKLNLETGEQEKINELKTGEDLSEIVTEQVTFKSKDGTPVNMFIVKSKNTENNGGNKTFLTAYGAFGDRETPDFSGTVVEWIKSGGVFAMPNIRGGSENGEQWHRGGNIKNKQNSFDDFIAAAEYLINSGLTKPEKLGIYGASNGGLLVGAVTTQRPELFGAVVCQVPLLDMIHFDRLKMGKFWRSEYGNPSNPKHFPFLFAYSPYHHVQNGVKYPAVLLQIGENDDRADAMHARKMAAALQQASSSGKPILLYKEPKSGHGDGMPISKELEEKADVYAFLESVLGD